MFLTPSSIALRNDIIQLIKADGTYFIDCNANSNNYRNAGHNFYNNNDKLLLNLSTFARFYSDRLYTGDGSSYIVLMGSIGTGSI